ncbi:hypothetical protein QBC41DRAFT_320541 [Cercophora samala]|uniref:GRF-type domain-containing protein n=1 Tax=Cercophora samala TaxID=330535 RepID=A0AA39ZDQ2_9PEZI|nr:hypothetical protein QBC41DRAFT_320541 [Cercophora samala]
MVSQARKTQASESAETNDRAFPPTPTTTPPSSKVKHETAVHDAPPGQTAVAPRTPSSTRSPPLSQPAAQTTTQGRKRQPMEQNLGILTPPSTQESIKFESTSPQPICQLPETDNHSRASCSTSSDSSTSSSTPSAAHIEPDSPLSESDHDLSDSDFDLSDLQDDQSNQLLPPAEIIPEHEPTPWPCSHRTTCPTVASCLDKWPWWPGAMAFLKSPKGREWCMTKYGEPLFERIGERIIPVPPTENHRLEFTSLKDIWRRPPVSLPTHGPACCGKPSKLRWVQKGNPNNNAGRPYYKCRTGVCWVMWGDVVGVWDGNPKCWCGTPSRETTVGVKKKNAGKKFWTCVENKCTFKKFEEDSVTA